MCDEVAVMRKGELVSVSEIKNENIESLANKMVGQNLKIIKKKKVEISTEQLIKISLTLILQVKILSKLI